MAKRVVALNSGGLDSALLCRHLKDSGYDVVSVHLASEHLSTEQELAAARGSSYPSHGSILRSTRTSPCSSHVRSSL